jgi:hypothetical protein
VPAKPDRDSRNQESEPLGRDVAQHATAAAVAGAFRDHDAEGRFRLAGRFLALSHRRVHLGLRRESPVAEVEPEREWAAKQCRGWPDHIHHPHMLRMKRDIDRNEDRGHPADCQDAPGEDVQPGWKHGVGLRLMKVTPIVSARSG